MTSVRRSSAASLNFDIKMQGDSSKIKSKGTRPLPNPVTIPEALLTLLIDVFRKILFVNTNIKVAVYLGGLFLSFIFDFFPFPKTYLSKSHNIINLYFVKLGWFWTTALTVPFVLLTSCTYCCGKKKLIYMHLSRFTIATGIWFVFTTVFAYMDHSYGKCSFDQYTKTGKKGCLERGHSWTSLDISGHAFILIWSVLVITEEAKVIIGWNDIGNMIQNEEHSRKVNEIDINSKLRFLSISELRNLKKFYYQYSPYVKGLFVALTLLAVLWDVMVIATILYYHIMVEKLLGGLVAITVWFITYRYWYPKLKVPPCPPGEGSFQYNSIKNFKGKN